MSITSTTIAVILVTGALIAIIVDDLRPYWPKRKRAYKVTKTGIKKKRR